MLRWRLIFGPILIVSLVILLWLDLRGGPNAPVLAALLTLLTVRGTWEFGQLVGGRAPQLDWRLLAGAGVAIVLANWIPKLWPDFELASGPGLGWPLLVCALAVNGLFLKAMYRFETPGSTLETLGIEVLALAYFGLFISATLQLRWVHGGELAYIPLASLIVVSKCGDTAAYFTGRALGGPKLCPRLSPGKTIAGAVGAIVGGTAGGWAWLHFGTKFLSSHAPGSSVSLILYGVVLSLAGMSGDLAESLIKRDVSQKDAPPLLPGFGGLLDLVDSIFFCGPVALLLWTLLPLVRPAN